MTLSCMAEYIMRFIFEKAAYCMSYTLANLHKESESNFNSLFNFTSNRFSKTMPANTLNGVDN